MFKVKIMENIAREIRLLTLPSTLWCIHIHPKYEFIGIIHIKISNTSLEVDKGLLLVQEESRLKVKLFLNGFISYLPNINLDIKIASDLINLIYILHHKNVCKNSVDGEKYPKCLKLIDSNLRDQAENLTYCSMCIKELVYEDCNIYQFEIHEELLNTQNEVALKEDIHEQFLITQGEKALKENECKLVSYSTCNTKFISEKRLQCYNEINYANSNENVEDKSAGVSKRDKNYDSGKHDKEMQWLCNVCGKMLSQLYRVEEHILTHTSEKSYQCKTCKKIFTRKFSLKLHEHTHTGERPYICNTCGKTYTTSSNLRTHAISCQGEEKRHVCELCNMKFTYPHYLKLHIRKHTGERPYTCSVCGKKFSKNIHLKIHMRTHTGEKPHACIICGKCFTTTGGLGYHKKVYHKNVNT